MKRRLFNLAAFVSLAICTAWIVLGARSYFVRDTIQWEDTAEGNQCYRLISTRGDAILHLQSVTFVGPTAPHSFSLLSDHSGWHTLRNPKPPQRASFWRRRGFFLNYSHTEKWVPYVKAMSGRPDPQIAPYRQIGKEFLFGVPYWFAALLFAIAPAWWAAKWRRRRFPKPGVCPSCGYDLRASPVRCPECGTEVGMRGSLLNLN
jgi:hypothetical protein